MNCPDPDNILLVHPLGYKKKAASRDVSRLANILPPIGIASIAAYLDLKGISSGIIDCYAYPEYDTLIRSTFWKRGLHISGSVVQPPVFLMVYG